jgi:hypothetical protein
MSKPCAKCGGRMDQGFIPDATDNTTKVTNWVEGQPQKRWYGLKTRGLRKLPIESWRCGRCGYLENYAPG